MGSFSPLSDPPIGHFGAHSIIFHLLSSLFYSTFSSLFYSFFSFLFFLFFSISSSQFYCFPFLFCLRLARVRHASITREMSSDAKKMTKDFRREKKQLDEEKNKLILNLRIVSDSVSAFNSKKPNKFRKSTLERSGIWHLADPKMAILII